MSGFCWLTCSISIYMDSACQTDIPLLYPSVVVLILFTTFGLNTIVLHVLSSKYHHLIIRSQQFLQQWQRQQQQHKRLKNTTKIMVLNTDDKVMLPFAVCINFHSCSSTSFWTFSTLWFGKCNSPLWVGMLFTGISNCILPKGSSHLTTVMCQVHWFINVLVCIIDRADTNRSN